MLDTHLTQLPGLWKYQKTMGSQSEAKQEIKNELKESSQKIMGSQSEATLGLKNQLENMYKKTVGSQSQIKASET